MFFLPSKELRFAFVVSKKVGNAVVRNKAKRRLRAIARDFEFSSGWFLFLATSSIKDIEFYKLQKDIKKCLSQLQS